MDSLKSSTNFLRCAIRLLTAMAVMAGGAAYAQSPLFTY